MIKYSQNAWVNSSPTCPRIATLTEIDTELDRLEMEEEQLIWQSELDGMVIDRRADCRPEIVLSVGVEG